MSHLGYICMHLENLYSLVGWEGSLCIWCSKECHKAELCVSECIVDLAVLNEATVSENLHISVYESQVLGFTDLLSSQR